MTSSSESHHFPDDAQVCGKIDDFIKIKQQINVGNCERKIDLIRK